MTATERNFKPDKPREYRLFLVWLNMAPAMKTIGHKYLDAVGINNPDIRELAGIKTQAELAEYLEVRPATLTEWKSQPVPEEYSDISWRNWLSESKPAIVGLVKEGLLKRKDAATAKFLLELEGEYTQTTVVKHDVSEDTFEAIKQIAERNAATD